MEETACTGELNQDPDEALVDELERDAVAGDAIMSMLVKVLERPEFWLDHESFIRLVSQHC
jgi:hypothetical protein